MHDMDKKYLSESQLFALNKAIESDPDEPENYFKRAKVYYERHEEWKALSDIDRAIKFKNNEGKFFFLKSQIFFYLNQVDSALKAARTAEGLNINNAEIKILLSRLNLEKGNKEEAQKYLSEAEASTPQHPEVLFLKGKSLSVKGDTNAAIPYYFAAMKRDTNYSDVYKELSAIYFNKKKYDSSLVFVAAGKLADSEEPFFEYQEGKVFEFLHLKAASKAYYLSALKLDSTFSLAYNALGKMFHQEGNDLEASHYFSKELTYNPSNISTNLLLAQIYEKQSRGDLAIPLLERVLKKDTSNKSVKSNLEKLYVTFPDRRPKAIVDTTVKKAPAIDTSNKPKTPEVVKKDTVKKTNPVKPIEKPKEVKKENKVLIPKIFNPDSTKIEKRPDSLK
jgi:Tfp pilus assembly protein PilF